MANAAERAATAVSKAKKTEQAAIEDATAAEKRLTDARDDQRLKAQAIGPLEEKLKKARLDAAAAVAKAEADVEKARQDGTKTVAEIETLEKRLESVRAGAAAKEQSAQNSLDAGKIKLRKSTEKLTDASQAYDRAQDRAKDATDNVTAAQSRLEAQQGMTTKEFKKSQKGAADLASELGVMEDSAQGLGSVLDGMPGKLGAFALAMGGAASIGSLIEEGMDVSGAVAKMNRQLGATGPVAEQYADEVATTMAGGVASGAEEAIEAVRALNSQIDWLGSEGEQTASELADNFLGFTKTFDADMSEVTQTAGQLLHTGLVGDMESAVDLMTAAYQRVPVAMQDELPEILQEYSVNFANLGLDGEEAFSLLVNQADKGKFALDKTGDSLKEFANIAVDPGKAEAFEELGFNAQQMAASVASGGDEARESLEEVAQRLLAMEDPGARAAKAIELFGTPMEDLGIHEIPGFLEGLTDLSNTLGETEGASQSLADEMANSLEGRMNSLKGTVSSLAAEGFMSAWDAALKLSEWAKENKTWLLPLAVGIGGLTTAITLWTLATKGYTAATTLAKTATDAFNKASKASIWGLVATAIIGVVTALTWFFTETETGQEIWGKFTDFLKSAWESVSAKFSEIWSSITGIFDSFGSKIGELSSWWSDTTSSMGAAWQSFKDHLAGIYENIRSAVFDAWNSYVARVQENWALVTGALSSAWSWTRDTFVSIYENIRSSVFDAFNSAIQFAQDKFSQVTTALSNSWTWLKDTLGAGWDWIRDNVFSKFTDTIGSAKDRFFGFVDSLGDKWSGLKSLLAKPVNFMINTVYNEGILRAWNVIAGILPGLNTGSPLSGIPEHATGGRISGPGTGTSDDVLMWGSNGEHMWTARETQLVGGHGAMYSMRDAVTTGRPFVFDGKGGVAILPQTDERAGDLAGAAPGLMIPGYKDGGEIRPMWEIQLENGHRAAKMRDGNAYTWAHEDCSGYMSMIADAIINGGDGVRRWATSSFPGGQPWVPGLGPGFSVGVHDNPGGPGGGHTSGTLTGVGPYMTTNVESGGAHGYVAYGGPAVGADSPQWVGVHPGQFHLAIGADGAFESGGSVDPSAMRNWISDKLGGVVDTIMDPLVSLLPSPPPQWMGIPRGVYDTGRDKMVEGIADGVAGLTDGLATVWNAVRNIPDLIRESLEGGDDVARAAGEGYHKGGLAGRGQGIINKTAIEPEMVLSPPATAAFIDWMSGVPQAESASVIAKEITEAFRGGDWGYGELASRVGSEDLAHLIVDSVAAAGFVQRGEFDEYTHARFGDVWNLGASLQEIARGGPRAWRETAAHLAHISQTGDYLANEWFSEDSPLTVAALAANAATIRLADHVSGFEINEQGERVQTRGRIGTPEEIARDAGTMMLEDLGNEALGFIGLGGSLSLPRFLGEDLRTPFEKDTGGTSTAVATKEPESVATQATESSTGGNTFHLYGTATNNDDLQSALEEIGQKVERHNEELSDINRERRGPGATSRGGNL
ncbi:conserved hypothetical protein [Corynebacterium efficiens YS-314]|uniref:Phage tail tape measure protein domain-containing protein n=2 Tax=Corynebacterium efficiens TaxID=152794 RepID=Q8FRA7_COREF|nr:conserved hypothetical protein [Corynebacterium efficiens YS-314]